MSRIILRWRCVHWSPPPPSHPHRRLVKSKLVPKETFSWKADHNINKELPCALLLLCGCLADSMWIAKWKWSTSPTRCHIYISGMERNLLFSLVKGNRITLGSWGERESFIYSTPFYCNQLGVNSFWQTGREGIFLDVLTCWIWSSSLHLMDMVSFIHHWHHIMHTLVQTELSQQPFDGLP